MLKIHTNTYYLAYHLSLACNLASNQTKNHVNTVAYITTKNLTEMYRSTLLDIVYEENKDISRESDASEQRTLT